MITCAECAKLGSDEWKPEPKSLGVSFKPKSTRRFRPRLTKRRNRDLREDLTIIENFGSIIRKTRRKLGLSQEELGRKISEKVSVIKKIEGERMMPDERLARKLERALGVKLLTPLVEPEVFFSPKVDKGVTLGEIAYLKNPKRRKQQNESDNS